MSICILCPQGHSVSISAARLGNEIFCPCCLTSFLAELPLATERNARPEKGKAKRSREDEDEDEKPQKKVKAKAKPVKRRDDDDDDDEDDDEEDEKPRKKTKPKPKPARKPRDEDEDEDEDDEDDEEEDDEEPEEEEEPIQWTPRKRQLNLCNKGVAGFMVSCYMLHAFLFFVVLGLEIILMLPMYGEVALFVLQYLAFPLFYLSVATMMVSCFLSLPVPAKAEARTGLISGLVFGGLFFFVGLLIILSLAGVLVNDKARLENMMTLLGVGSALTFIICFISVMGYQSRLLRFMQMHLESSQPIANGGFFILAMVGLCGLLYGGNKLRGMIGDWLGWIMAVGVLGIVVYAGYVLGMQIKLLMILRKKIITHIKDA